MMSFRRFTSMVRRIQFVAMAFVGLVNLLGASGHEGGDHHEEPWANCDRKRSRHARAILDEELFPVIQARGYQLPSNCVLSRQQDMYYDNEMHKKEVRYQNWRCTYCNKVFKGETFLERHFENRHPYTIPKHGVCLADHCEMLECDLNVQAPGSDDWGKGSCNQKLMQRRRHRCQAVFDQCFPPHHSDLANQLHHHFEDLYCSHLSCIQAGHGLLPAAIPDQLRKSSSRRKGSSKEDMRINGWKKLYIVLGVLFCLVLVIFYVGICLYRRDMSIVSDLKKLSKSKRMKRMELLKAKQI